MMFKTAFRLPFRLLGIPVLLDVTFLIVLPLLAWLIARDVGNWARLLAIPDPARLASGWMPYALGLTAAVGLFVSVVVHELGHAIVARAYGVPVHSITLWFLGGVAQMEQMPRQRGAEAVIAVVGPIVSIGVAMVCGLVLAVLPAEPPAMRFVLGYLAVTNVVLAAFNLLPALPLDGGRVLRSLLAMAMPHLQATMIASRVSKVLAVLLGIAGFLWAPMLLLVAFFIYMAGSAETRSSVVVEMLQGISVRDLMQRRVATVPPHLSVGELMGLMVREHHLGFPVMEDGRVVGMVTLQDLSGADPAAPVSSVMKPAVVPIPEHASALDAFTEMGRHGFGRLVVLDELGRLSGIITKTDLMRAIQIRMVGLNGLGGAAGAVRNGLEDAFPTSTPAPVR